MPGYRSPSGRYVDWAALVHAARAAGGRWVFAFANAPASMVRDIRQKRSLHLHHPAGELVAEARNRYENPDTGTDYADVYVRWDDTPTKEQPMAKERHDLDITDNQRAELAALAAITGVSERGGISRAAAAVLAEYAEGAPRPSVPDPYSPVRLRLFIDPAVWSAASARADAEGISVTAALAEFTPRVLDRERRIRREGADLD